LPLTAHAGPPAPTIAVGEYAARRDFVAALGRGAAFVRAFASRPKNRAMVAKVRAAVTRYNNIGVRIEDDYAITPNRLEWLSRAPREPAEIESAMARRGH
jgi:Xaa-Pro aminopeptidase